MKPLTPKKTSEPVKYHCHDSCNSCCGVNDVNVTDTLDGRMMECKTTCRECGHQDYWAYGFFESSQDIVSKCQTYSFG